MESQVAVAVNSGFFRAAARIRRDLRRQVRVGALHKCASAALVAIPEELLREGPPARDPEITAIPVDCVRVG